MSLFMFSENGSSCGVCGPFEGKIFTDANDPGYEPTYVPEGAGVFHGGCSHSWIARGAAEAQIKKEDQLVARGTEWDETDGPDDFIRRSDFDAQWQMLTKTNGPLSTTELRSLKSYTNSGYSSVNTALRSPYAQPRTRSAIKNLDNAMAKSSLKHDMTVYRGTNSSSLDKELLERVLGRTHGLTDADLKKLIGETFTDKGYFSTSAFKEGALGSRRYEMQIISPKGTRATWVGPEGRGTTGWNRWRQGISSHTDEAEFLLDRGTEFRILNAYKLPNGNIRLNVIARQKALDPAARLAAEKAEARAANALAKKAATQAQQQAAIAPAGPIPSPTSVAQALEKMNAQAYGKWAKIEAAWTGPDTMMIRISDSVTGQIFRNEIVTLTKAEAKAAKLLGNGVQAVKYENTVAAAKSPATSAVTTAAGKVPASEVKQLLTDLGMTKGQLAKATGKSPSLMSEWTGGGHGNLLTQAKWQEVKNQALAWVKAS